MDIKFKDNILYLPVSKISFKYNVERIIQVKSLIVVLLDVPIKDKDSENSNNIYAVDLSGKKIWK